MSTKVILIVIGVLAMVAGFNWSAHADIVEPCVSNAASGFGGPPGSAITFLPIKGGGQTYCQSAFGWSDTWFASTQPATYDQHLDVLSGDNAPNLTYTHPEGGTVGTGNPFNFIGPWADQGALNAGFLGSNWLVVSDITVPGGGPVGTSTIANSDGLQAHITTTVAATGVTELFVFTNLTSSPITDLLFSDYFNFHANGSLLGDVGCPTTTFDSGTGTVTTTGGSGGGCSPVVSNGSMHGSLPVAKCDLGTASSVLADIAASTYNGCLGGPITGDGAADLVWDLGALDIGQSVEFTIFKNFRPREEAPEPASLALFASCLTGLAGVTWRRRYQ